MRKTTAASIRRYSQKQGQKSPVRLEKRSQFAQCASDPVGCLGDRMLSTGLFFPQFFCGGVRQVAFAILSPQVVIEFKSSPACPRARRSTKT
jgi:hypothetical protein